MQQTPQVVPDPVEWLSKVLHRFWVILEGEVQPLTTGPPCCGHFLQEVRPFVLEGPHGFFPTQIPVNRIVRLQHGKIVGRAGNGEVQFLVPVSPCHLHARIVLKQVLIPLPNVALPILQLGFWVRKRLAGMIIKPVAERVSIPPKSSWCAVVCCRRLQLEGARCTLHTVFCGSQSKALNVPTPLVDFNAILFVVPCRTRKCGLSSRRRFSQPSRAFARVGTPAAIAARLAMERNNS